MAKEPHHVGEILDSLEELARGHRRISVGDVLAQFGPRSYGPILIVIPLIDISPIGAIPGLPTFMALILALTAAQLLAGQRHIWLPGFVARRTVSARRLGATVPKLRGVARRLDRWFHGRLRGLTAGPLARLAGAVVLLLCCLVPPLELIPLATTVPMLAIGAIGLALLVRDGALMLAALALGLAAFGLAGHLWLGGGGG